MVRDKGLAGVWYNEHLGQVDVAQHHCRTSAGRVGGGGVGAVVQKGEIEGTPSDPAEVGGELRYAP